MPGTPRRFGGRDATDIGQWNRKELPSNHYALDIDFIWSDKDGNPLVIFEEKRENDTLSDWQRKAIINIAEKHKAAAFMERHRESENDFLLNPLNSYARTAIRKLEAEIGTIRGGNGDDGVHFAVCLTEAQMCQFSYIVRGFPYPKKKESVIVEDKSGYTLPPGSHWNEYHGSKLGKEYPEWQEGDAVPEWMTITDPEKFRKATNV